MGHQGAEVDAAGVDEDGGTPPLIHINVKLQCRGRRNLAVYSRPPSPPA